jgi:hypothetical protein
MIDTKNNSKNDFTREKIPVQNNDIVPIQQPTNKISLPLIAGILLILSGVFALLLWISLVFTINVEIIASAVDLSQLQEIDASWTAEKVKDLLVLCGATLSILALFPILGGILSLKRKLWGIALGCSIIGLSTFLLIIPGILCLIALILLVISRKEFQ